MQGLGFELRPPQKKTISLIIIKVRMNIIMLTHFFSTNLE